MKKFVLAGLGILFAISCYAKDIQQLVVTTNPPLSCQNCENKIKKGDLRFVKGVKKIETSIPDQRVVVEYDADQTNPAQLEETFHKIGYEIEVINPAAGEETVVEGVCSGGCCGTTQQNEK